MLPTYHRRVDRQLSLMIQHEAILCARRVDAGTPSHLAAARRHVGVAGPVGGYAVATVFLGPVARGVGAAKNIRDAGALRGDHAKTDADADGECFVFPREAKVATCVE